MLRYFEIGKQMPLWQLGHGTGAGKFAIPALSSVGELVTENVCIYYM
jgi:hypothetical protein